MNAKKIKLLNQLETLPDAIAENETKALSLKFDIDTLSEQLKIYETDIMYNITVEEVDGKKKYSNENMRQKAYYDFCNTSNTIKQFKNDIERLTRELKESEIGLKKLYNKLNSAKYIIKLLKIGVEE
jgi:predicted RNase H-like nuclease (RuvC/YqgF family)